MLKHQSPPGGRGVAANHADSASSAVSRRRFMGRMALAGGALAIPTLIPATAIGRDGKVPPSERIIMAGVGIGGRGTHDLNWMMPEPDVQFVAICDAKKASRNRVKQAIDNKNGNTDCKMYSDIRDFLAERTDIDACLCATGDRWHALAATMIMRSGKDVYSEKPSAMTIAEGRMVVETQKRYGRVYQTGTQRLSEANFVYCFEMARLGYLGKLHTSYAHIAPWDAAQMRHDWEKGQPEPPKDEIDWDQWLGPCPWRPFNISYTNGGWRNHYDFHTSCIGEWGAHTFAQVMWGIDQVDTAATLYEYIDNPTGDGMHITFPNGVKMILYRDGSKLSNPGFHGSCAMRFDGPEGWVAAGDGYAKPDVSNPSMLANYKKLVGDYMARTQRPMNHVRDFLNCVKSRRLTVANAEVMHRSMTVVHAANICMWLKRNMKFDPVKEEFIGDPEANRLRSRAMRAPWIF